MKSSRFLKLASAVFILIVIPVSSLLGPLGVFAQQVPVVSISTPYSKQMFSSGTSTFQLAGSVTVGKGAALVSLTYSIKKFPAETTTSGSLKFSQVAEFSPNYNFNNAICCLDLGENDITVTATDDSKNIGYGYVTVYVEFIPTTTTAIQPSLPYIQYSTTTATFTTLTTQQQSISLVHGTTTSTITQPFTGLLTTTATGGGIYNTTLTSTVSGPVTSTTTSTGQSTSIYCALSVGCRTITLTSTQTIILTTNQPSTILVTQAATSKATYTSTLQTTGYSTLSVFSLTGVVDTYTYRAFTTSITLTFASIDTSTLTPSTTPPKCLIATATYGSELAPEVQLLRSFRDNSIMKTNAGSNFMIAFNAWYYSFSPYVASYIANHSAERTVMKGVLYPLIGTLYLTSNLYGAVSAYPELASLVSGVLASSLIGVFYLGLPLSLLRAKIGRMRGLRAQILLERVLGLSLLCGTAALLMGEIINSALLLMLSSVAIVLSTLFLSAAFTSTTIAKRLLT